jgi:hypothetical protein
MDWLAVLNTSVGLMSLALGGFAIFFSLYLYTKSKDTEKEVARTLEAIKAQSEALQKLTGRWMDRFTRHATEPRPADEGLLTLVSAVANLPTTILTHMQVQPQPDQSHEALTREVIDGYVGLYYYSALANVVAQALLPGSDEFDENEQWHATVKSIVDKSDADFQFVAGLLNRLEPARLQASSLRQLLDEAITRWRPYVRTSAEVWAARDKDK